MAVDSYAERAIAGSSPVSHWKRLQSKYYIIFVTAAKPWRPTTIRLSVLSRKNGVQNDCTDEVRKKNTTAIRCYGVSGDPVVVVQTQTLENAALLGGALVQMAPALMTSEPLPQVRNGGCDRNQGAAFGPPLLYHIKLWGWAFYSVALREISWPAGDCTGILCRILVLLAGDN